MLLERITGFVRGDSDESFETLALEVFRHRYQRDASFRDLCDRRGSTPEAVSDWRQTPLVGTQTLPAPATSVDGAETSRAVLGRAVVDGSFAAACLAGLPRPPVLSLIPRGEAAPDAGLAFLAERVLQAWAAPDSTGALAGRRLEAARARGVLAARQRDRRPLLILATPATLAQLLAALERRGLRFRLPPGSRVAVCGGSEPIGSESTARLADVLAVPPDCLVRDYGLPALRTRFYAAHGRQGDLPSFRPPAWARVRVVDPETGAEVPPGSAGSLAVFDLASPETASQVLTGDAAVASGGGFRLGAP